MFFKRGLSDSKKRSHSAQRCLPLYMVVQQPEAWKCLWGLGALLRIQVATHPWRRVQWLRGSWWEQSPLLIPTPGSLGMTEEGLSPWWRGSSLANSENPAGRTWRWSVSGYPTTAALHLRSKLTSLTHNRASDQLFSPFNHQTTAMYYHISEESSYHRKERLPVITAINKQTNKK